MKDNNSNHPEHATSLSPAARLVFDKALTRQLLAKLVAFAKRQQTKLAKAGIEDLVQTAIVKTLDGTRKWDHENTALADHLKDVIDSHTSIGLKHAHKFPSCTSRPSETATPSRRRSHGRCRSCIARPTRCVLGRKRPPRWRTQRDATPVTRRVLDAYAAGARTRHEVMALSKMTKLGYAAAYARIKRLCAPSRVSSEASK